MKQLCQKSLSYSRQLPEMQFSRPKETRMTQSRHSGIAVQRAIACAFLLTMMFFAPAAKVLAQSLDSREEEKGMVFYEKFQGSSNTLGQVMKMDTTVGYNL